MMEWPKNICSKAPQLPVGPVLQVDPSVLFQSSSIYKTLATLSARVRLDAEVGLEVPGQVVLLLESLVAVNARQGAVQGASGVGGEVSPVLASHLKEECNCEL